MCEEYGWVKDGIGKSWRVCRCAALAEGIEFEPVGGGDVEVEAPSLGLNDKVLTRMESEMVSLQLGKPCNTWADVKKACGTTHRIVEPGCRTDKAIRKQRALHGDT
jgi:hypothetical protein